MSSVPDFSKVLHIDPSTGNFVENSVGERFSVTAAPNAKPWAAATTYTIKGKKVGNEVTLYLPAITGTSAANGGAGLNDNITFTAIIPAGFRPSANRVWAVPFQQTTTDTAVGFCDVTTGGNLVFTRTGTNVPDFEASTTVGALATTITYSTDL